MNSPRLNQLNEMLAENENDPFIHYAIGMELTLESIDKGIEKLQQLADLFPDYLPTYYQLATLLYEDEQYETALTFIDKGILLATAQQNEKTRHELNQLRVNVSFEI